VGVRRGFAIALGCLVFMCVDSMTAKEGRAAGSRACSVEEVPCGGPAGGGRLGGSRRGRGPSMEGSDEHPVGTLASRRLVSAVPWAGSRLEHRS
jgi:hypothetical protein